MSKTKHEDLLDAIALSLVPKLGPVAYRNIISYCGSAHKFFTMPPGKAAKIPGLGQRLLTAKKEQSTYLREAEKIWEDCQKHHIQIHTYQDKSYPSRLKSFVDSPVLIYTQGNIDLNPPRTIGIVGTRNASEYGKMVTRRIVEDLAPFGPTVISGLAYGIDAESHRSALQMELPTIAVLGNTLDRIYPRAHIGIAENMKEKGGLVTEYKIGTALNPNNFPARNRIIASLSDALIVVEAAKKGGALITAEIAYSYNREVFAVPGNLQNTFSEGCNNLIRSMKAAIYTGPRDIQEALSWSLDHGEGTTEKAAALDISSFSTEEQSIIRLLTETKELEMDRLSWQTNIPIAQLASQLLNLEFQGVIRSLPGKKYALV